MQLQTTKKLKPVQFWKQAAKELRHVRSMAGGGMLAALGLLLEQMTIVISPVLEIGFSFLSAAISAYLYGPLVAGLTAVVVDIIGFFINPNGGFFVGFTLNAFLSGVIYGCWLYNKPVKLWRVFAACLTTLVLFSFLLNPIWFNIMYGQAFVLFSATKLIKNAIILPMNTTMLYFVLRIVEKQLPFLQMAKNGKSER